MKTFKIKDMKLTNGLQQIFNAIYSKHIITRLACWYTAQPWTVTTRIHRSDCNKPLCLSNNLVIYKETFKDRQKPVVHGSKIFNELFGVNMNLDFFKLNFFNAFRHLDSLRSLTI